MWWYERFRTGDEQNRIQHHVRQRRGLLFATTMVGMVCVLIMMSVGTEYGLIARPGTTVELGTSTTKSLFSASGGSWNKQQKQRRSRSMSAYRERVESMRSSFSVARQAYESQLQVDYGVDAYKAMFFMPSNTTMEPSSVGRLLFGSFNDTDVTFNRSKSVLVEKLVRGLLSSDSAASTLDKPSTSIPLVWATGGNSVAAGHGNMYEEAALRVMTRAVSPALQAAGLDFDSRLYPSSAASSAPEAAFCTQALYGADVDILVWDFSVTDGHIHDASLGRMEWYFTRASAMAKKPQILLALNVYNDRGRLRVIQRLADKGLAILYSRRDVFDHAERNIPDTFGKTAAEIEAMPRAIQKFKCGGSGKLELNPPLCLQEDKFNPRCPERYYQTNWHPGWKWNALLGNMLALFVLDFLDEALREVSTLVDANMNVVALLQRFEADNRSRYQTFRQANFDDSLKAIVPDESQHDSIDWNLLVKGSSYCHLAVLPSETRRKGIISNDTSRVLDLFSPFDSHAISRTVADAATVGVTSAGVDNASSTTSDTMRLVYETDDKTPDRFPCNETLYIDFREYFYVSEPEGWRHVIVPNEAELNEYGTSINGVNQAIQSSAAVAFCLKFCNHFVCPTEDLNIAAILSGNATMEINGRPVTQLTQFINTGHECVLTGHDEGRDWIPNAEGRFVIRARALWPKSFLRFTSFVVWYTNGDSDSGSLTEKNK